MNHDDYISEGTALSDSLDCRDAKEEYRLYLDLLHPSVNRSTSHINLIKQAQDRYDTNVKAKVGDTICCPSCGRNFKKKSYQQKFHSTKCKDIYWNSVDPIRRERAQRYR